MPLLQVSLHLKLHNLQPMQIHDSKNSPEIAETAYLQWAHIYLIDGYLFESRLKLSWKHGEGINPPAKPDHHKNLHDLACSLKKWKHSLESTSVVREGY